MRHVYLICALIAAFPAVVRAQSSATGLSILGRVVDSADGAGVDGIELLIPAQKRIVFTAPDGSFQLDGMRPGVFTLCIRHAAGPEDTLRLFASPEHPRLADIRVRRPMAASVAELPIPEAAVPTDDAGESGPAGADYAAATQAGRNPFSDAVAFNLFPFRFQPRAYNRRAQEVSVNGLPVQDPASGNVPWNAWSGLNDAFRNREQHAGLEAADGMFGGLGGSLGFDITAAAQRPQQRLSYALTNRSYRNRLSYSRSSGMLPSGWAWSVNASYRAARESFVPGTFTEGAALYAGLSRSLNAASSLHLSFCGAWSRVGRSAAITEECAVLSGDPWYNPNWGLQHGKERNARVSSGFQPFVLLSHQYRPGKRLRTETTLMMQGGRTGLTGLDYYNASNPRPDYYRYLPSYYLSRGRDPSSAAFYTQQQIGWDELYQQNRVQWDSVQNADGIAGNTVAGRRSVYGLYRDVADLRKLGLSTVLQWRPSARLQFNAGMSLVTQQEQRYRVMEDLLGGDFYLNTNPFIDASVDGNAAQYDLNVRDRIIREGDRYGYDYIARSRELLVWSGLRASLGRWDIHLAGRVQQRAFSREGRFRNGLFPAESFGRGAWQNMDGLTVKGGISYRLSGRSQALLNLSTGTGLPGFDQSYISPRVRNTPNAAASPESFRGFELGLMHRSNALHLHLMAFATQSWGASEIRRYYSDDPAFASFVNYLMTGVSRRHRGLELGADLRLGPVLSLRGALSVCEAYYAANPDAVYVYGDNDTSGQAVKKQVYIRNLALANGPQTAGTLGLTYRSTKYWYAGISANYAARSFVDVNPDRRSEAAVQGLDPESRVYRQILDQEKLPASWTLDISAGKNWLLSRYSSKLPRNTYLYVNASVANALDRRFRTGGYEQLRFDYAGQDPSRFATKYFYATGRNFIISLSLRW